MVIGQAQLEGKQLVKMARQLERLLARRRRVNAVLVSLERDIRQTRKFLDDLVKPLLRDAGAPLAPALIGECGEAVPDSGPCRLWPGHAGEHDAAGF